MEGSNDTPIVPGRAGSHQCTCIPNALVTVPSYLHLFTAALMCVVAAGGQSAVWLHSSVCGNCEHSSCVAEAEVPADGNHCGGCSHQCQVPETAPAPSSPPTHDHDPDSCAICLSMDCPAGNPWTLSPLSITLDLQGYAQPKHLSLMVIERFEKPRSRGPPMRA